MPKKKREAKQAWITEEILQKMKERKKYKGTVTYTKLDKEIKRDCIKAFNWLAQEPPFLTSLLVFMIHTCEVPTGKFVRDMVQ